MIEWYGIIPKEFLEVLTERFATSSKQQKAALILLLSSIVFAPVFAFATNFNKSHMFSNIIRVSSFHMMMYYECVGEALISVLVTMMIGIIMLVVLMFIFVILMSLVIIVSMQFIIRGLMVMIRGNAHGDVFEIVKAD